MTFRTAVVALIERERALAKRGLEMRFFNCFARQGTTLDGNVSILIYLS